MGIDDHKRTHELRLIEIDQAVQKLLSQKRFAAMLAIIAGLTFVTGILTRENLGASLALGATIGGGLWLWYIYAYLRRMIKERASIIDALVKNRVARIGPTGGFTAAAGNSAR
jgi:hypothetical protein